MTDNHWTILPYPYSVLAQELPLRPLDVPDLLERLLEDMAGQAGVVAAAGRTLFTQQAYSLGGVMRGGESRNSGGTWESF